MHEEDRTEEPDEDNGKYEWDFLSKRRLSSGGDPSSPGPSLRRETEMMFNLSDIDGLGQFDITPTLEFQNPNNDTA